MLRGVVEGVYAVDANRNVKYLNPQAERMLGVESGTARRPLLRRRAEALRVAGRRATLRDALPDRRLAPASTARRRPRSSCSARMAPGAR